MDEVDLPENEFDIFISLLSAYCAANNLDFIVSKAILSVKPGGVYNPENLLYDETETKKHQLD